MLDEHQAMFELVDLLNDLLLDNPDNPVVTSEDWPFVFETDGDNADIKLHGQRIISTMYGPGENKKEWLEAIKNELRHWLPALQSAQWAIEKALEKFDG